MSFFSKIGGTFSNVTNALGFTKEASRSAAETKAPKGNATTSGGGEDTVKAGTASFAKA